MRFLELTRLKKVRGKQTIEEKVLVNMDRVMVVELDTERNRPFLYFENGSTVFVSETIEFISEKIKELTERKEAL